MEGNKRNDEKPRFPTNEYQVVVVYQEETCLALINSVSHT
jgi:hypothetical protein